MSPSKNEIYEVKEKNKQNTQTQREKHNAYEKPAKQKETDYTLGEMVYNN